MSSKQAKAVPKAYPRESYDDRPRYRPAPRRRSPKSSSSFGCLAVLLIGAIIAAVGGYFVWMQFRVDPTVRIDSPVEGQSVPGGIPLQVWISADDPEGVQSLALTAELDGVPVPVQTPTYTFASNTTQVGSHVFDLTLSPGDDRARTLTLTATSTNVKGKTLTTRRSITFGGTAQDFAFQISHTKPKPYETVTVTLPTMNLASTARISYTVNGTDYYVDQNTQTLRSDGSVQFQVPGSFSGVQDTIEAWIEGTSTRRKVVYRF